MTEALEEIVRENDRLHLYIQYLGSIQQIRKEAPPCRRRIMHEGEFYCVQTDRKGFKRMKKLPTLEICQICKLEKLRIPESTKVKKPVAQTIRNPNVKHEGMLYCHNGGLWVFPSKCEKCSDKCKNYYTFMKNKST